MQSNVEWKKWGEIDPLYAVSSWKGKSRRDAQPWTDEEFYEMGRSDWSDFRKPWEQFGVDPGVCLEIGCGAGRITRHLAAYFRAVKAVDVSEGMISYAREHIDAPNVDFILVDGNQLPLPDASVDAVFSTHVFQHLEALPDASRNFREIGRVLAPGGTLMVHLPFYIWPNRSALYRGIFNLRKALSDLKAGCQRFLIKRGVWTSLMRGLRFDVDWLTRELDADGFGEVEYRIFRTRSNGEFHPFVLARKSPA